MLIGYEQLNVHVSNLTTKYMISITFFSTSEREILQDFSSATFTIAIFYVTHQKIDTKAGSQCRHHMTSVPKRV
jgi:hypothetical protein